MKEFAIAAAFVAALATPALAAQYYVALNTTTNQCQIIAQKPDGRMLKMLGSGAYGSPQEAQQAAQSLPECSG